jgi:thiol-disulfide isomerase/thioredoxin
VVHGNVHIDNINSERFRLLTNNYSDYTHIFLFSRDSCKSCIEAKPIIKKVFSEIPNNYYTSYYDTDENKDDLDFKQISQEFNITKVPTIIVFSYNQGIIKKIDDQDTLMNYSQLLDNLIN